MRHQLSDFDLFYLSYDEPNCEANWADLLEKAPWARRVHGIKGFDSAHKECARQSATERFITVDGDNIVDAKMFDTAIDIPDKFAKCALSWNSINAIHGLVYGNGGVKLWTKEWVMGMRSHEHAQSDAEKLDFCWDNTYLQLNSALSTTHPNGSPFQAFRAGFREGVKMTLDRGARVDRVKMKDTVHAANLNKLLIWATVGADVENGLESIYGTRLGIYMANIDPDFDIANISDYDWFKKFGAEKLDALTGESRVETKSLIWNECERLGRLISSEMGLELCMYSEQQSAFFKQVYEVKEMQYSINLEKEIVVR